MDTGLKRPMSLHVLLLLSLCENFSFHLCYNRTLHDSKLERISILQNFLNRNSLSPKRFIQLCFVGSDNATVIGSGTFHTPCYHCYRCTRHEDLFNTAIRIVVKAQITYYWFSAARTSPHHAKRSPICTTTVRQSCQRNEDQNS
jgi:hypothetical protein